MIMRTKERKKLCTHVTAKLLMNMPFILVFLILEKTSANQHTNEYAQHRILSGKNPGILKQYIRTCPYSLNSTHRSFKA